MSQPSIQTPLQIWTFLTGTSAGSVTDTYRNVAVKNKDTIPFSVQVVTTDASPANITVTQDSTVATYLRLSATNWDPSKIKEGGYVFVAAQGLKRKIVAIHSASLIEIEYAFPSTVTAQNLLVADRGLYRYMRVEEVGTDTGALFDGVALKPTSAPVIVDFPETVTYDSSAANQQFRITLGL